MDLAPDAIDWFAIFSVIALFAVVLIYAYWPSNNGSGLIRPRSRSFAMRTSHGSR